MTSIGSCSLGILISLLLPLVLCQFFSREDGKNAPRMGRRSDPLMERDPRSMINNDSIPSIDSDQDPTRVRKVAVGKFISALLGLSSRLRNTNSDFYPWLLMGGIDKSGQSDNNDFPDFH